MPRMEDLLGAQTEWTVVATATNAVSTATKAAVVGQRHYVTWLTVSASAAPAATVTATVKDGTTPITTFEIPASAIAPIFIPIARSLRGSVNSLVEISVPALGTGVKGTVTIGGFTRT